MRSVIFDNELAGHGVPDYHTLTDHLASLTDGFEVPACGQTCDGDFRISKCHSLCRHCHEIERRRLIITGSELAYRKRWRGAMFTVTNSLWSANQGQLQRLKCSPIFDKVHDALAIARKSLDGRMAAIGGLEITLNQIGRHNDDAELEDSCHHHEWGAHFHIEVLCGNPEVVRTCLVALTEGHRKDWTKPLRMDRSFCVGRHISYATKFKIVRRALDTDNKGNKKPKERPLNRAARAEAIEWFLSLPLSQRMFSIGI
jgi:hypothetical protein